MSTLLTTNIKHPSAASNNITLDSSGRFLVGTASTSSNTALLVQGYNGGTTGSGIARLCHTLANPAADVSLGYLVFGDSSHTDCAWITGVRDGGTWSGSSKPTRLVFSTTADGASSPTERMRIDSNGVVSINNSADLGAGLFQVNDAPSRWAITTQCTNPASGTYYHWNIKSGSANVGAVTSTTTTTTFATNSDYRLKENVVSLTGAIDRVNQLQVHRFNFTADPDKTVDGFIAHEAQAVVPECVTGEKDAVDDDGNPIYQGIDQSKLVPLLTAALQEAIAKIETLEAKVAALEVTP